LTCPPWGEKKKKGKKERLKKKGAHTLRTKVIFRTTISEGKKKKREITGGKSTKEKGAKRKGDE